MTSQLLCFNDVVGGYNDTMVVSGISGVVGKAEVLGIFGRNGVGKSTLSKLVVGALPLSTGSLMLDNKDLSSMSHYERRRHGVGYMPQTAMVFDSLTVRENLFLAKSIQDMDFYLHTFPRLLERQDQVAGTMSGGERKILAFVRTMLEDTNVVILDEPSEGVQPENILKMQECMEFRRKKGTAFLLVEQNLAMLTAISNTYLGIDSGKVVFSGDRTTATRRDILNVLSV